MTAALAIQGLAVPVLEPEFFVFLDVETFYDADFTLKKLQTSSYIRDERFEGIGVGVNDGEETVWMEWGEFREWSKTVPWERTAVGMHHAHFDGLILSHHFNIHPAFIICTMSMARTFGMEGGVSLGALAEHFGVGHKGHEVEDAKGKRRKDFTQAEWLRYGEYCKNDVELTKAIFDKMMEQGFPEPELWLIDQTVRMFSEPRLFLDEPLLQEFLVDERKRKADLLERIQMDRKAIGSNETLAQAFRMLGAEPPTKLSPATGKPIYAFAKNDPGMQELLEDENDEIRFLAEARIAVKSTTNETRTERFLKMGANNAPMPVYLSYFKAHTGRWAGGDKTNFQNLGRVNKKKPKSGVLKKSLLAPRGYKVVAADSNAIEARMTAWLAGHEDLVAGFRENRDVYSDFASQVYGRAIDRIRNPEDEVPGFLGKVAILGLGYQMSWPKLSVTLLAGAMGGPPVQLLEKDASTLGVNLDKFFNDERSMGRVETLVSRLDREALAIHCACAEFIVKKYRKANAPIVELWASMEDVIETMTTAEEGEEFTFGPNDCLVIMRHRIRLPNGLYLRYPGLRQSEEEQSFGSGYSYLGQYGKLRQKIYGGLLTENCIQALARIVVGEQMVSVKAKYGYDPVLMTHDEIAEIAPEDEAPLAYHQLVEEMKIAPSWAAGLPLHAKGGWSSSYGEVK